MDIKELAKWMESNYSEEEINQFIKVKQAEINKLQEEFRNSAALCEEGSRLEKEGDLINAVMIYEGLLEKNFVGSHPYDRLAVIYKKLKRKDDVIRVLEKAVEIEGSEYNKKAKQWPDIKNYPGHRKKLEKYIEKLEAAKK